MTGRQIVGALGLVALGATGALLLTADSDALAATKAVTFDTAAADLDISLRPTGTATVCRITSQVNVPGPAAGSHQTATVQFEPSTARVRNACNALFDLVVRKAAVQMEYSGVDAGE